MTQRQANKTEKSVDPKVIETLVCPLTKTRLSYNADRTELISHAARMAFPITGGVPMLCLDESRDLDEEELTKLKR